MVYSKPDKCTIVEKLLLTLKKDPKIRDKYEKTIEPILIEVNESDPKVVEKLINRLVYTIIDQRRDVVKIVIPIWYSYISANPLLSDIKNGKIPLNDLEEIFASLLKIYGHERALTSSDSEELLHETLRKIASRSHAVVHAFSVILRLNNDCLGLKNEEEFVKYIIENYNKLVSGELRRKFIKCFKMISDKSLDFFLRDIILKESNVSEESLDSVPVPVDTHVNKTSKLLGIYFTNEELEKLADGDKQVLKLIKDKNYDTTVERLRRTAKECKLAASDLVMLSRALFLLGSTYCDDFKCGACPLRDYCFSKNTKWEIRRKIKKFLSR